MWLAAAWRALAASRGLLTLVAIAAAAAFLWAKWAGVTRERDAALTWIIAACSSAGATVDRPACLGRVRQLAAFERDALAASNAVLARAARERDAKLAADLAAARTAAERTRSAVLKLEKADAQVSGDRVGADWFGAVNDAAGLRADQ